MGHDFISNLANYKSTRSEGEGPAWNLSRLHAMNFSLNPLFVILHNVHEGGVGGGLDTHLLTLPQIHDSPTLVSYIKQQYHIIII